MTDKMREALIDAVMQPSLDEIVKAAIAHGVEDAPNEKNEMRHRRIASMVRALFAERHQAAQSVPEGYVMVPVEPTQKMMGFGAARHGSRLNLCMNDAAMIYDAMLSAAPEGIK